MIRQADIDHCTACTSCVAECPVTKATRAFRGPKLLGPGLERFRLFEDDTEASCLVHNKKGQSCKRNSPLLQK